jgi:hypothetical protein
VLHGNTTERPLSQLSVVRILKSVEQNAALQSFSGAFYLSLEPDSGLIGPLRTAILELVSSRSTLSSLGLLLEPSRVMNDVIGIITEGLQHNHSLSHLDFSQPQGEYYFRSPWFSSSWKVDDTTSKQIVDVLSKPKPNTTLTTIKGLDYDSAEDKAQIEWLLTLNRYKRAFLCDPRQVEQGWWPHVLARIALDNRHDVMFHFVRCPPGAPVVLLPPVRDLKQQQQQDTGDNDD